MDTKQYINEYIEKSQANKIILGGYDKEKDIYMLITDLSILHLLDYKIDYDSKSKQPKLRIKDNRLNKNIIISQGIKVATAEIWEQAMVEWMKTHKQQNRGMVFEKLVATKFEYQTPHSFMGMDFIDNGITYECKFVGASIQHY